MTTVRGVPAVTGCPNTVMSNSARTESSTLKSIPAVTGSSLINTVSMNTMVVTAMTGYTMETTHTHNIIRGIPAVTGCPNTVKSVPAVTGSSLMNTVPMNTMVVTAVTGYTMETIHNTVMEYLFSSPALTGEKQRSLCIYTTNQLIFMNRAFLSWRFLVKSQRTERK